MTQMDGSEEDSDGNSDGDEDAFVVDMKRPPAADVNESPSLSTKSPTETSDDFLKSPGKFSFGTYDRDDTNVSDLFIPEEALKPDKIKLFVSEDDPDLLK